jgi:hypothetical protein
VVLDPLYFNKLLGRDYVYAMNLVVSMIFHVMHFSHNESIVTTDHQHLIQKENELLRYFGNNIF